MGTTWLLFDAAVLFSTGATLPFFVEGGILDSVVSMLSVMVGIYFGLAGLVATSNSPWMNEQMPGGITIPGKTSPMTRSEFFMSLMVYCSALSMTFVFLGASTRIEIGSLFEHFLLSPLAIRTASTAQAIGSIVLSSVVVAGSVHLFTSSILSLRFLTRNSKYGG